MMPMEFRPFLMSEMDEICQLEMENNPYPWGVRQIRESLERDITFVALRNSKIMGFVIFYDSFDSLELLLVVTSKLIRRQGVAKELIKLGLSYARSQPLIEKCMLEVRASNTAAIELYKALGFMECGLRKNYYNNGKSREDALLFTFEF